MIFASDAEIDTSAKNEKVIKYQIVEGVVGGDVLEVGCGGGTFIRTLARRFPKSLFTGFDTDNSAIAQAKMNSLPNLKFTGDRRDLGRYDVIFLMDVLEHQKDAREFLSFIRSLTHQDSIIVLHVPVERDGIYAIKSLRAIKSLYSRHESFFGRKEVRGVLSDFFKIRSTTYHYHLISGFRDFLKYYLLKTKKVNKDEVELYYTVNWQRHLSASHLFKILDLLAYYETKTLGWLPFLSSGMTVVCGTK